MSKYGNHWWVSLINTDLLVSSIIRGRVCSRRLNDYHSYSLRRVHLIRYSLIWFDLIVHCWEFEMVRTSKLIRTTLEGFKTPSVLTTFSSLHRNHSNVNRESATNFNCNKSALWKELKEVDENMWITADVYGIYPFTRSHMSFPSLIGMERSHSNLIALHCWWVQLMRCSETIEQRFAQTFKIVRQ